MVLYVCLFSLKPIKYQIGEVHLSCGATVSLCQLNWSLLLKGTGSRSGQVDLNEC